MASSPGIRREKVAWAIVGVAVTLVVAFVLSTFLGAIVVGIFLYYATRPAYRWLDARFDHPDWNATATLLLVGLPMLVVLGYAALLAVRELDQFLSAAALEEYRAVLKPYVDVSSVTDPGTLLGQFQERLPQLLGILGAAILWVVRLFIVFVVAFYLLRDDRKIGRWFRRSLGEEHDAVAFLEGVDDDLSDIYVANLVTVGATTLVAVISFYGMNLVAPPATGIAYPFLLALLIGIGTFVPAVGMKIVYVPFGAYLLYQSATGAGPLWFPLAFFAVTFLIVDSFPDIFVRSYLSSGSINMGLMLLAYTLTPAAFGWYGVFLAPIVVVLFVHFARRVFPNLLGDGSAGLVSG